MEDKTYLVILVSSRGHESEHKFNAASRELAARSALVKYPYHHVKSVGEIMNYEEMSDFEINKLVAGHLHGEEWWHKHNTVLTMQLKPTDSGGMELRKFPVNYCKNPSDAWPIMIGNDIFITPTRDDFEFKYMTKCLIDGSIGKAWTSRFTSYSDNPLRAAMICFLKMKDAERE